LAYYFSYSSLIKLGKQPFGNTRKALKTRVVLCFFLFCFCSILFAHAQRTLSPQAIKAIDLFNENRFNDALPEFKHLSEKFPKDPLYMYYLGACMVEMNVSPILAISYLKTAEQKEVDNKALYYLGLVNYRQFQFSESKDAFLNLKSKAKWQENKQFGTAIMLDVISKAPIFFSKSAVVEVLKKSEVLKDSVRKFIALESKNENIDIKLSVFPNELLSGWNTGNDEYFYFSAKGIVNTRGKDIFRVKRLEDASFSEPENLGQVVNSFYDEDHPFFDTLTNTLYFSSKGHNSMGGFDIFSSKYNKETNQWSQPEQLSFPINSQWNDFMWIQTIDQCYFSSDRFASGGKTNVYQIKSNVDKKYTELKTSDEMVLSCNLSVSERNIRLNSSKLANKVNSGVPQSHDLISLSNNITIALKLQKECDSFMWLARQKRMILANTEDKDKRNMLFSEIAKYEKQASRMQKPVNEYYQSTISNENNDSVSKQIRNKAPINETIFSTEGTSPYTSISPIPLEAKLPEGIVYRIQLGVYSKRVSFDHFSGLQPISAELLQDGKIIKYYVGIFGNFEKADSSLKKVKDMGFKEAFVIAFYNNRKIPLERAKGLEYNDN
jgi:hypothetical protein